jgi:hypothetical protein
MIVVIDFHGWYCTSAVLAGPAVAGAIMMAMTIRMHSEPSLSHVWVAVCAELTQASCRHNYFTLEVMGGV